MLAANRTHHLLLFLLHLQLFPPPTTFMLRHRGPTSRICGQLQFSLLDTFFWAHFFLRQLLASFYAFKSQSSILGKLNGDSRWYLWQIIFRIVWGVAKIGGKTSNFKIVVWWNWLAYANWELCGGEVGGRIILIMQILQTWAIFPNTGVKNFNSSKALKLNEFFVDMYFTFDELVTDYSTHVHTQWLPGFRIQDSGHLHYWDTFLPKV